MVESEAGQRASQKKNYLKGEAEMSKETRGEYPSSSGSHPSGDGQADDQRANGRADGEDDGTPRGAQ